MTQTDGQQAPPTEQLLPDEPIAEPVFAIKQVICQPKTYTSIPHAVLARADLPPAAKLVYAAILDGLRGAATSVTASVPKMAAMTALSRRTIQRVVRELLAAPDLGLCLRRVGGRGYVFSFIEPGDGGDNMTPEGRQFGAGGVTKQPRRGDNSAPLLHSPTTSTSTSRAQRELPFLEAAKGRARDAYLEVFATEPPYSWWRRWEREAQQGDATLLEAIDATAIRKGMALASRCRWTFGLGAVIRVIEGNRGLQRKQQVQRRTPTVRKRQPSGAEMQTARVRDHFVSLPADQQADYRQQAKVAAPVGVKSGYIEAVAWRLAWEIKTKAERRS